MGNRCKLQEKGPENLLVRGLNRGWNDRRIVTSLGLKSEI